MLFQEDVEVEQKPNTNSITIGTESTNGTDNENYPEVDEDSSQEAKRIRIDGTVSLAERCSVDSANGHKNGDIEETESVMEFDPKIQELESEAVEAQRGESPVAEPAGVQSLFSILEKEVNNLDNLLVTKELEWNALLRLKKLKELLLEQLRREEDISSLLVQSEGTELKVLLKECILEQKYITKIDSDTKSSTNRIKNESAKVELEITENSGRRYRKIVSKESLWAGEARNASKALQKLCERNSANSLSPSGAQDVPTKQGPKGPIVQVTSLIADYRAKRKHEAANKKQKTAKIPNTPSQISYSDVLVSLAKISSTADGKSASPEVSSTIATAPSTPKSNARIHGLGKSNITLAKLLSASGSTTTSPVAARNEDTKSGDDYKGRHLNSSLNSSSASDNSISLSNLLASNPKQGRNEQSQKSEGIPICQGCNTNQAQFVCAGCGNQWYCSRDCQVEAWDDHSELCSGG